MCKKFRVYLSWQQYDHHIMKEKDKYLRYFVIISVVIVIVSIGFPLLVNHYFKDWGKSGTFGDTFGALNAIFSGIAIAGLIITILIQRKELENQRIELALQRTEMQETRNEFLINRISNIIYSQLERYEKALEQFKIENDNKVYNGYEAIFYLDSSKQTVYYPVSDKRTAAEILKEKKTKNCLAMKIYSANDKSIAQFALSAYNSVEVVKETLLKSDLTAREINDLKNIFFRNLGFIQLGVLEDISIKFKEYLELSTVDDDNYIEECDIEYGKLSKAQIFLKSLLKFRATIITDEVIKETKEKLTEEFGAYA